MYVGVQVRTIQECQHECVHTCGSLQICGFCIVECVRLISGVVAWACHVFAFGRCSVPSHHEQDIWATRFLQSCSDPSALRLLANVLSVFCLRNGSVRSKRWVAYLGRASADDVLGSRPTNSSQILGQRRQEALSSRGDLLRRLDILAQGR